MKLLRSFFALLLVTNILLYSCNSKKSEKNYFAIAGIKLPSSSSDAINKVLEKFPELYNELSAAVERGDKELRPKLADSYANWLIEIIELKASLPGNEKQKLTSELEALNAKWNDQIDKLL